MLRVTLTPFLTLPTTMFSFYWPWMGWLLPVPLLFRWLWPAASLQHSSDHRPGLLHPMLGYLQQAYKGKRPVWSHWWLGLLLALLWINLVLALMRPQWLEQYTEVKSLGYDLILAVDVSRSMAASDFSLEGRQVSRMEVVKDVVTRFIAQRQGDRIGLIVFGDQAYVLSPLTLDVAVVNSLLAEVTPRMVGDATAIGDAIGLAIKKLRDRPTGSRVLVLLTDGENTAGSLPPMDAARLAASYGIKIYTIGVGSSGLVPLGKQEQLQMDMDEALLQEIAAYSSGAYFRATHTKALEEIYQQIDRLEKTEAQARSLMVPEALYRWPLGVAMAALLLLGLSFGRR